MARSADLIVLAALVISGCASGSDVFRVSPDTYQVTTTAITSFGGAGKARSEGIKRATAYCAQMGKTLIVSDTATDSDITQGTSDITFRCEDSGATRDQ